jgi:hypothetical protein
VNDNAGLYFTTRKGLRHGDTSALLLFSNVDDVQTTMTKRAGEQGLISGLAAEMYDARMLSYTTIYTDGAISMFKNILDNARNLKIILCTFENLTRKIREN